MRTLCGKPPRAVVGVLLAALAGTGGLIGAAAIANSAGQPAGARPNGPARSVCRGDGYRTCTCSGSPSRWSHLSRESCAAQAFRSTSGFTPAGIREFSEFALFSLGESFEGLSWSKIDRVSQTAVVPGVEDPIRPNYVNFIYGTCEPLSETGCSPPLRCKSGRRANARSPTTASVRLQHAATTRGEDHSRCTSCGFRGPARTPYTGDVTVVIFGLSDVALRAAEELKPANEFGIDHEGRRAARSGSRGHRRKAELLSQSTSREASFWLRRRGFCRRDFFVVWKPPSPETQNPNLVDWSALIAVVVLMALAAAPSLCRSGRNPRRRV